ncbi:hypothetical protein PybrP1_005432 [[Pythium] brassicae (nom. inval.)]|nr:hypothetical protein PybrP1_005432 [[Pythium] brassicae (nom. inval.)]
MRCRLQRPSIFLLVVVVKTDAADNAGFALLEIRPLLVAVLKLAAVELALAVEAHDGARVPAVVSVQTHIQARAGDRAETTEIRESERASTARGPPPAPLA